MSRKAGFFLLGLAALAGGTLLVVAGIVERGMNVLLQPPPYLASPEAQALHARLLVADLHADSLLWGRDLLRRSERGHVDLPRLQQGNVALQVFSVVTKTPRGLNIERNDDRSDNILPLALVQGWPPRTWRSLKERALYQAQRLHDTAARSQGALTVVATQVELRAFLARRAQTPGLVAGVLAIEGAQALDGDPANVDALFAAGFRMMSPTHFFDDEMAGSAHGLEKGGLTDKGRDMIRRMEAKGMIVDIAHASPKTIDEILAMAKRPVVVSHGGVKGTCDNRRNLSDAQLRRIAVNGGLVGIGYWETAVCGRDAKAVARAIRYTVDLIGLKHVALGSDYDGAVAVPFDTTGLVLLTQALMEAGFGEAEIARIMGGNELDFLLAQLPE
ncbi:peptidase M19 [Solimonas sp. K1W22B-7]|nr:peptidase M19 [Solimonas sp. K1W22B-7]